MANKIKTVLLILLSFLFSSCDPDSFDVTIEGIVLESATHQPIPNVKINLTYWVTNVKIESADDVKRELYTNSKGYFKLFIKKCSLIDISIAHSGYSSKIEHYHLGHDDLDTVQKIYLSKSNNSK